MIFSRYSFEFSSEFQGSHRTIQFSISFSTVAFDGFLIYHSFSHLSSWIFKIFKTFSKFLIFFQLFLFWSKLPKSVGCIIYHTSNSFSSQLWKIFQSFLISFAGSTEALSSSITDDFLIYISFWTIASRIWKNFEKKSVLPSPSPLPRIDLFWQPATPTTFLWQSSLFGRTPWHYQQPVLYYI